MGIRSFFELDKPEPLAVDVEREKQLNHLYAEMGVYRIPGGGHSISHVHLPLLQALHDRLKALESKP